MANLGNTLGPRSWYEYHDDGGTIFGVLLDDTNAAAGEFELASASRPALPRKARMRGVHIEGITAGRTVRKFLPCATAGADAYNADGSNKVTIDGVDYYVTGRRGEKFSWPRYYSSVGVTP